jgi:E3 ubiquitin-protein ligase HERC2
LCPNGRTNSGLNRDRWIPNVYPPNQSISNRVKKQYRFIGQLMGMAIRKKHYLDLKFPILLWKQLVRESITIEDIEAIDVQSFTMINEMEKTIKQTNQSIDTDSAINDLLSTILDELRFEAISSAGQTFELVPDEKDIPITASNFKEYCTSYREYRLNEFDRQIEFIRQGLYSVVSGYFLGLFTASELEEAVCGKGNTDMELLKRNTGYGGNYNQESPVIQRFWTVLCEMCTEEQKKLFLKFVSGRCTLPSCDDDFTAKLRIDSYDVSNGPVDGALPSEYIQLIAFVCYRKTILGSHTCSFVLDLPDYSSIDIMYDRLNYAITYCSSIDGDGGMNGPGDLVYSDSD